MNRRRCDRYRSGVLRIGLLQCDDLDPPHRDHEGGYVEQFTRLLTLGGLGPDVAHVVVFRADRDELPAGPRECDGWLITGSRAGVYEDRPWIAPLTDSVRSAIDAGVPTVGVCFGHQLVAHALGAHVSRHDGGWNIGAIEYRVCASPPLPDTGTGTDTDVDPAPVRLVAIHQDQVHEVPSGLRLLAEADTCAVAGVIGDGVLTVQGHPEFGPAVAESLYRARSNWFGDEAVETAVSSLAAPLSAARVAGWITATLAGR